MTLNREAILAQRLVRVEKVNVPEWNGAVYVRVMSGAQRDAWETQCFLLKQQSEEATFANMRARLIVACACNESGDLMFFPADADELGKQEAPVLERIFQAAQRLNSLSKEDVDELVKNSQSEANGASGSASPSPSGAQ